MTKLALTLAAGVMLGGFGLTAASAAPAMPSVALVAADAAPIQVAYRKHHRSIHHHRSWRRHHMRNRMRHGDPNARNPAMPGYAQQKGNTSGGPRY
ncbi:hypothetical protein [Methylobacterium planeticum]|uniref:Uncharacterized protein n=1 Tax=Methylobacterium planeticum TaxID=2615211 RepID=A0A6N6MYI3_9HYPH|nr:hypothetical protein [Methylobacterium planeticum]KAB1076206.1 hypothetical protein F6X51_01305 [Methylobacterium planeticum]